jgi:hypothetical protein
MHNSCRFYATKGITDQSKALKYATWPWKYCFTNHFLYYFTTVVSDMPMQKLWPWNYQFTNKFCFYSYYSCKWSAYAKIVTLSGAFPWGLLYHMIWCLKGKHNQVHWLMTTNSWSIKGVELRGGYQCFIRVETTWHELWFMKRLEKSQSLNWWLWYPKGGCCYLF